MKSLVRHPLAVASAAFFFLACGSPAKSPKPAGPPNSAQPQAAGDPVPAPVGASTTPPVTPEDGRVATPLANDPNVVPDSDGCVLRLRTSIASVDGANTIEAYAKNATKQPVAITVDDQCHVGIVRLTGVPRAAVEQACNMGMCAMLPGHRVLRLAPGEEQAIGGATIFDDGGVCGVKIEPGQHPIAFTLPQLGSTYKFCGPKPVMFTAR